MDSEDGRFQISNTTSPAGRISIPRQTPNLDPVPSSGSGRASQPATPGTISFVDLPKRIRDDIYKRVLVLPHQIYLFQERGSRVETFAPRRPIRWLALLYSNRQVSCEARAVLYGMNRFVLVDTTQQQVGLLRSFLNCIGSVNAGFLSHLAINFPVAEKKEDHPGEVKIREDGLQSLRLLQARCTNLATLETYLHSENSSFLTETAGDNAQLLREALLGIDVQLKAISSLKKMIVRVYIRTLPPLTVDLMQGLGWVVMIGR